MAPIIESIVPLTFTIVALALIAALSNLHIIRHGSRTRLALGLLVLGIARFSISDAVSAIAMFAYAAAAVALSRRFLCIGLTGGIGSGKSLVARALEEHGAVIVDLDIIARKVVEPGTPALASLTKHFGAQILLPGPDKRRALDRSALRAMVASDPSARRVVNKVTHPAIATEMLGQIAWHRWLCGRRVVIDAPLLFESGGLIQLLCSPIITVAAQPRVQVERVMARDSGGEHGAQTAQGLIASQMPLLEKARRSDILIDNGEGTSLTVLRERVDAAWQEATRGYASLVARGPGQKVEGVAIGREEAVALAQSMLASGPSPVAETEPNT